MKKMVFRNSIIFLLTLTMVSGCTNSEWVLSAFYSRMDNILATEVKEYADFSKEQSREIDLLADQYHHWHRTQHLPSYANLLRDIDSHLQSAEPISRSQVVSWSDEIEGYARELADCYPLNTAYELLTSLSDEQVEQVLAHGVEEYDDFFEERVDITEDKRIEKRYNETRKWFGRFQLDLNKEQKAHLKETITNEAKPGAGGMELWKTWHFEFVELLNLRYEDDFEENAGAHIRRLWTLQDDNFPEVVEHNRQLWIDYFSNLSESLSESQKKKFSTWLQKMAGNLESISMSVDSGDQIRLAGDGGACSNPYGRFSGYSENFSSSLSPQDQVALEFQKIRH